MPPGTPYNSYVLPYRIRVDDFSAIVSQDPDATPLLHLLTHTHTDHINGLSARSFGYKVICSKVAKEMLLRHQVYAERELQALDLRAEKIRTYAHLKVDPLYHPDGSVYYTGSRDLLHVLPLNSPTSIELTANESVTLTLIDANHCPGAVMYLIEGPRGNILHTGDFRAEAWFLQSISRNSFLQPYLAPDIVETGIMNSNAYKPLASSVSKTLDAIYLDTACVLSPLSVPPKDHATTGLIDLMKMYPDFVYFFINSWTWGYEDILKSVARAFQTKVHVDGYKYSVFHHIDDPFLQLLTTRDPSSTRFHACERFHRCEFVDVENDGSYSNATSVMGKRVVYVNPVTMSAEAWSRYLENTKARIRCGEVVNNLLVPLSRHSPLPELQEFVNLFRPKRLVPNTLDPRLHGLDWVYIDRVFAPFLCPASQVTDTRHVNLGGCLQTIALDPTALNDGDVALKNLVGNGASDVAERWADDGKLQKRLAFIKSYLVDEESQIVDNLLGIQRPERRFTSDFHDQSLKSDRPHVIERNFSPIQGRDNNEDDSDQDSNDERGRTAHALFSNLAGIDPEDKENAWWGSSPTSSPEKRPTTPRSGEPKDGSWRLNRVTPPVSPPLQVAWKPSSSALTPKHVLNRSRATGDQLLKPSPAKTPVSVDKSRKQNILHSIDSPRLATTSCLPPSSPPFAHTPGPLPDWPSNGASVQLFNAPKSPLLHTARCLPPLESTTNLENRRDHVPSDTVVPETPPRDLPSTSSVRKHCPDNVDLPFERSSSPAMSLRKYATMETGTEVAWVPTEREYWHHRRIAMSQRIAEALPNMVAPSFENKRKRHLAQLERKGKSRRVLAASSSLTLTTTTEKPHTLEGVSSRKLKLEPTLLSFESVHDENESEMDWDRSRLLVEAIRQDLANGRKPVIPPLQCAQSQSPQ